MNTELTISQDTAELIQAYTSEELTVLLNLASEVSKQAKAELLSRTLAGDETGYKMTTAKSQKVKPQLENKKGLLENFCSLYNKNVNDLLENDSITISIPKLAKIAEVAGTGKNKTINKLEFKSIIEEFTYFSETQKMVKA